VDAIGDDAAANKDDATGVVLFFDKSKETTFEDVRTACPYNIPRQDEKTKVLVKCDMCLDRITNNRVPSCVLSCPTGAMTFGDRETILDQAKKRVEVLKQTYPKAAALNADEVRVIYIVTDDPTKYHEFAVV